MKVPVEKIEEETSLWSQIGDALGVAFKWTMRYPLALVVAFLVIVLASLFMFLGMGDKFNWGGIIGKLFGKTDESRIQKANKIPDSRVDEEGNVILIGEPDEEGFVQKEVSVIDHSKNPFRDKTKVEITTDEGKKKISLPKGVEDTDVDKVLEIKPEVYEVKTKKRPSERVTDNDLDLLK